MTFNPLRNFLSFWHFKLIGLIGPGVVSERVNDSNFLMLLDSVNSTLNFNSLFFLNKY
jgi:hypothetical protein